MYSAADCLSRKYNDSSHGRWRRQEGILTEILEVSAAQGSAINIHAGPKHEVHAASASISPNLGTYPLRQLRIPSCRQSDATKDGSGPVVSDSDWSIRHF